MLDAMSLPSGSTFRSTIQGTIGSSGSDLVAVPVERLDPQQAVRVLQVQIFMLTDQIVALTDQVEKLTRYIGPELTGGRGR